MVLESIRYPKTEPELIAEFEASPVPLSGLIGYSRTMLHKSITDLALNGQVSFQLDLEKLSISDETDVFFCYNEEQICVGRIVIEYGMNEIGDNLYMISRVYKEQ